MTSPGTLSFRFMHTGPPSQFSLLAISFPPQGFAQTVPPAQPFFLHPWSLDQLFIFQVSVSMPLPQVGPLCPSTHGNLGALPQLFLQSFLLVINTVWINKQTKRAKKRWAHWEQGFWLVHLSSGPGNCWMYWTHFLYINRLHYYVHMSIIYHYFSRSSYGLLKFKYLHHPPHHHHHHHHQIRF